MRLLHHYSIKEKTGVDLLIDLIGLNCKGVFDSWNEKFMVEAKINYKKIVRYFMNIPLGKYHKMKSQIAVRTLMQAYGDNPGLLRDLLSNILKECRKKKHGRKSQKQKRLSHRSLSDFIRPCASS